MKVVLITHHFMPEINGTATRVNEIAKKLLLLNTNLKIFIVAPAPSRPFGAFQKARYLYKKENFHNASIVIFRVWNFQPCMKNPPFTHRILNYIIFPLLGLPLLLSLVLVSQVVIVVSPPTSTLIMVPMIKILRKRVIVDITDLWHEEATGLGFIKAGSILLTLSRSIEVLSLRCANYIWVATRRIKDFLGSIMGISKQKMEVLPTPIDTKIFRPFTRKKKLQIIYAGNFGKPQALDLMVKAMATIIKRKPLLKLILVGGGECEQDLRLSIRNLKLDDNVIIMGPMEREKLPILYSESLLGLIPLAFNRTLEYAVPTKLYEYLACGLPFLSYGVSKELNRLAKLSGAGINVNDLTKIAQTVINLLDNPHIIEQMSCNAIKFIESLDKQCIKVLSNSFIGKHKKAC
jgi:glycosyltransferase involved in cell wall biosynthesis